MRHRLDGLLAARLRQCLERAVEEDLAVVLRGAGLRHLVEDCRQRRQRRLRKRDQAPVVGRVEVGGGVASVLLEGMEQQCTQEGLVMAGFIRLDREDGVLGGGEAVRPRAEQTQQSPETLGLGVGLGELDELGQLAATDGEEVVVEKDDLGVLPKRLQEPLERRVFLGRAPNQMGHQLVLVRADHVDQRVVSIQLVRTVQSLKALVERGLLVRFGFVVAENARVVELLLRQRHRSLEQEIDVLLLDESLVGYVDFSLCLSRGRCGRLSGGGLLRSRATPAGQLFEPLVQPDETPPAAEVLGVGDR